MKAKGSKRIESGASAIVSAVAGAAGIASGDPFKLAGVSIKAVGALLETIAGRRGRQAETFFDELIGASATDQTAAAIIRAKLESADDGEPIFRVVEENLRRLVDSIDEAVRPSLVFLTWLYSREGRGCDRFLRGVGRLLSDLDAEEFHTLASLVGEMAEGARSLGAADADPVRLWFSNMEYAPGMPMGYTLGTPRFPGDQHRAYVSVESRDGRRDLGLYSKAMLVRVLHALEANRLGVAAESYGAVSVPRHEFHFGTLQELARVLSAGRGR